MMNAIRGLMAAICESLLPAPGSPPWFDAFEQIRNHGLVAGFVGQELSDRREPFGSDRSSVRFRTPRP
jgi:hypothetical protein